ncbi:MAG: heparinase II/III family protein [Akkermansiaceae bacterium]
MKSTQLLPIFFFVVLSMLHALALPEHPRLLATDRHWKDLKQRMEREPVLKKIVETSILRADSVIDAPPLPPKVVGRRMLNVSRTALMRILDLSTAWKITGQKKYFDRCRTELLNVCSFNNWHPIHHLDTAEMQAAVAIGYDWLYHELSPEVRKLIQVALLEKGLNETVQQRKIMRRHNNWNQVCMGGLTLSSIALMDVYPEKAKTALDAALAAIPTGINGSYSNEGAYAEGGGYWEYGTQFTILTIEALRTAGIPADSISNHKGFRKSGKYISQVYGTSKQLFNYGDTSVRMVGASPSLAWMARETGDANLRNKIRPHFLKLENRGGSRLLALSAFWFPSKTEVRPEARNLGFVSGGPSPIVIHRTGFEKDDLFLGIKAGKAEVNHGHMDAGSFVIDWAGSRWASDLGKQGYHELEETGMSLFDMTQESLRWSVFRLNNHSHNTLTYNGKLHQVDGAAKILSSKQGKENTTLLDMTSPLGLPEDATATRRFTMDSTQVRIIDQLQGLKPGDKITWNFLTSSNITKSGDALTLEKNQKRVTLKLLSPQQVDLKSSMADPPPKEFDEPNPTMSRVSLETVAGKHGNIHIEAVFLLGE